MKYSYWVYPFYIVICPLISHTAYAEINQPFIVTLKDYNSYRVQNTSIQLLRDDETTTCLEPLMDLSCSKKLSLMETRQTISMTTGPLLLDIYLSEIYRIERYVSVNGEIDNWHLEFCDGALACFDGVDDNPSIYISGYIELADREALFLVPIDDIRVMEQIPTPQNAWINPQRVDLLSFEFGDNRYNPQEVHAADVIQDIIWDMPAQVAPGSRVRFSVSARALENLSGNYWYDVFKQWEYGFLTSTFSVNGYFLNRTGEFLAPTAPGRYSLRVVFAATPRDIGLPKRRPLIYHGEYFYRHQTDFALYSTDKLVWAEYSFEVMPRKQALELAFH